MAREKLTFDLTARDQCPVCKRWNLRFFSKDHCRHPLVDPFEYFHGPAGRQDLAEEAEK